MSFYIHFYTKLPDGNTISAEGPYVNVNEFPSSEAAEAEAIEACKAVNREFPEDGELRFRIAENPDE